MKRPGQIKQAYRLLTWALKDQQRLQIKPEDRQKIFERYRALAWVCGDEDPQNQSVQKLLDDLTRSAKELGHYVGDKDAWPPR